MRTLPPLGVRFAPRCLERDGGRDEFKHLPHATGGHPDRV